MKATSQKITKYFIEKTDFGFVLKGNREISGITTISIHNSKKEAEIELKKLTSKKLKTFENIEINNIVSFEEDNLIKNGLVVYVEDKIFTLKVLSNWDNNGTICYYDKFYNFFKSGIKTNRFYTNGNAIEITGKI